MLRACVIFIFDFKFDSKTNENKFWCRFKFNCKKEFGIFFSSKRQTSLQATNRLRRVFLFPSFPSDRSPAPPLPLRPAARQFSQSGGRRRQRRGASPRKGRVQGSFL